MTMIRTALEERIAVRTQSPDFPHNLVSPNLRHSGVTMTMLGVMQPYFFPYLGYFDLINRSERWIVFDTPQYMREGWVNRNRILHSHEGWQYIVVPLKKHSRETSINQVEAVDFPDWRRRIVNQFTHYRGRAPFYREGIAVLEDCLAGNEQNLSQINVRCLGKVCQYLGIPWAPEIFSTMNLELGPVLGAADWALRITEAAGATDYINPPGGVALYDPKRFEQHGIRLHIQEDFSFVYDCSEFTFIPNLSVLDAMMWVSPLNIKIHLDCLKERASQMSPVC
jgi:hypothetical protein